MQTANAQFSFAVTSDHMLLVEGSNGPHAVEAAQITKSFKGVVAKRGYTSNRCGVRRHANAVEDNSSIAWQDYCYYYSLLSLLQELRMRRATLGDEHPHTLASMSKLALLLPREKARTKLLQ